MIRPAAGQLRGADHRHLGRTGRHGQETADQDAGKSAADQSDTDLKLNKPELRVLMNRDKIASVGTDVGTVGRTLETMLGGRNVTRFKKGSEQYDVIVQVR